MYRQTAFELAYLSIFYIGNTVATINKSLCWFLHVSVDYFSCKRIIKQVLARYQPHTHYLQGSNVRIRPVDPSILQK